MKHHIKIAFKDSSTESNVLISSIDFIGYADITCALCMFVFQCQFTFVCEAILRVYRERMKKSSTPNS